MTPELLVDQWRRGLRIAHRAHYEAAKYYYRMHLVLSLPALIAHPAIRLAAAADPRAAAAMRRIEVIRNRIKDEREKFGAGDAAEDGTDYATIVLACLANRAAAITFG